MRKLRAAGSAGIVAVVLPRAGSVEAAVAAKNPRYEFLPLYWLFTIQGVVGARLIFSLEPG